jgi:hypothetical protein
VVLIHLLKGKLEEVYEAEILGHGDFGLVPFPFCLFQHLYAGYLHAGIPSEVRLLVCPISTRQIWSV